MAAQALGELGAQEAYPDLQALLTDEEVRSTALVALGRLGNPKALRPLLAALRESEPLLVQSAAAQGLGTLGDVTALVPLKAVAADANRDPGVRYTAQHAAGRLDRSEREPRTFLIWTIAMAMIVAGIAIAALAHAAGVLLFLAGCALLFVYWWRHAARGDTRDGGGEIWADGGWGGHGGGGNGGG